MEQLYHKMLHLEQNQWCCIDLNIMHKHVSTCTLFRDMFFTYFLPHLFPFKNYRCTYLVVRNHDTKCFVVLFFFFLQHCRTSEAESIYVCVCSRSDPWVWVFMSFSSWNILQCVNSSSSVATEGPMLPQGPPIWSGSRRTRRHASIRNCAIPSVTPTESILETVIKVEEKKKDKDWEQLWCYSRARRACECTSLDQEHLAGFDPCQHILFIFYFLVHLSEVPFFFSFLFF